MEYDLTLFEKGLEELGIALSQEQKKQFITYYEYLVEKNKVMNLTAVSYTHLTLPTTPYV